MKIEKKMTTYIWGIVALCFIGVAMIAGAVAMLFQYQNNLVSMQNRQLASIAENVATMTELIAREYLNDLESLYSTSAFVRADREAADKDTEELSQLIESYYFKKRGILSGIVVTDPDGNFLAGTQELPEIDYRHSLGDTDSGVCIDVIETEDRQCFLEMTITTQAGNKLYYLLDTREIYNQTAAHIKMGEKGYVMVKDNNGRILMHPVEHQIGIDVLEDRKKRYPDFDFSDLEQLVEAQNSGETGVRHYNSYWWADEVPRRIEKISAYTPAEVGDSFLVISAVIDYEELAGPIRSGAIGLMGIAGAIILFLAVAGRYLMVNTRKQIKVQRENQYLKEVNMKLTEIHKQEEKLAHQQRLQTIGTLTTGIAHEFGNLLTPIMGYSSMILQNMEITDENYEDLETIYASSVKAKEIIDQISAFSGKNSQQTFQKIAVEEAVKNALKMVESVKPKTVELEISLGESVMILGNPTQLQQVILNLCTNAFHAMDGMEQGVLKVTTALVRKKHLKYQILVEDNGCGMTKETVRQIFDPFFTTKKMGDGTGLGLSIVQRIVENHNGTIEVESKPGEGTLFKIQLPVLPKE